ncbi:putative Ubiquitin conjugating enzyme [Trypanosoma vivax]|uniref:Putative ubiquitin-conjugating enzyme e2 n=1 Tax=Trypanosoma vivax (strain Y486) TaxID=1055687 RepID=G0TUG0_TRYVY|nr:putative ubiquitin-conjugating enzyme e2 [Trypanosoma vivax]KAH8607403.1 putative Ubiquitin conjugating enzyme [Trypanosoma vivax]CCC47594.1 putative ubiquitin-conjugating enzyme e2 [Trypanosoma vivax Y486]
MSSLSVKRIGKDLQLVLESIKTSTDVDATKARIISVTSESLYEWTVVSSAPANSIYGTLGHNYELAVLFSDDYPHEHPTVSFTTPIYSPLVTPDGNICEKLIESGWTPDQHASDAIMLVLYKVFEDYAERCEADVHQEARKCLELDPIEYEERVRHFH